MGGYVALQSVNKNFSEELQFCSYHNGECNKIHLQHYQKYIVCRCVVRKLGQIDKPLKQYELISALVYLFDIPRFCRHCL